MDINFNCNSAKLSKIVSIGLVKNNQQKCNVREIKNNKMHTNSKTLNNFVDYTQACSSILNSEFLNSNFTQSLSKEFDKNCQGLKSCSIKSDLS